MRPGGFQGWVVFLRIEVWVVWGRQSTEQVAGDHPDDLRVHSLGEDPATRSDVVHDLVEGRSLDLLPLEVRHGVHEVEANTALPQLPDEEFLLLWAGNIYKQKYFSILRGF